MAENPTYHVPNSKRQMFMRMLHIITGVGRKRSSTTAQSVRTFAQGTIIGPNIYLWGTVHSDTISCETEKWSLGQPNSVDCAKRCVIFVVLAHRTDNPGRRLVSTRTLSMR